MRSSTDRRPPQRSDQRREAILGALDRWLQDCDLEAWPIWLSTIYGISWMPEWSQETA
jgi:hypothetical protein